MKNHLKSKWKPIAKSISKKDTKISPKTFPGGLQNPSKWGGPNPENRLPAGTQLSESSQDDL